MFFQEKKLKRIITLAFMAISLLVLGFDSHAQAQEKYTDVHIYQDKSFVEAGDSVILATHIRLDPHWHVYWKNPGDSGLPVNITWDAPEGFEFSEIEWPTPEKITFDFLANYGFHDEVILLQTLKIPENWNNAAPVTLTAQVDMLVCYKICIPENDTISIHLNTIGINPADATAILKRGENQMPTPLKGEISFYEQDDLLKLRISNTDINLTDPNIEFYPYNWGVISHVESPELSHTDNQLILSHIRGDQPIAELEQLDGVLVVGKDNTRTGYLVSALPTSDIPVSKKSEQTDIPVTSSEDKIAPSESSITWISALYLALFGGLILNLMPCVFPVLSMKALSLIKMSDKEEKQARLYGVSYTLGVVLSFLAIGGALLIFKEAGASIGWGFQLQNPFVVAVLAYLLFAIGLNLIGFFEFDFGLSNVGNKLTQGHSVSSSFFTGALATIVATPCTAPFMGAAMGFAIAQPAHVSMSVFASLGFGLALPYLLLSFIPALRKALPRPGAWMNTFKQFLAFPMLASSIWLIWVLDQQSGSLGVLITLLGMLSIAFAIWLSHIKAKGFAKLITRTLMIICLLVPVLNASYIKNYSAKSKINKIEGDFGHVFSKNALNEALKTKNPVFVEMTAAWCITCKVNHASSIDIHSTRTLFSDNNITYLMGDWTQYDEEITEFLNEFRRNGVPIYVFYPAPDENGQRPEPVLLPEILTPSIVQNKIKEHL